MTTPETVSSASTLQQVIAASEWRLDWLKHECQMLERKIELFDDLGFRIKGWAIATWSGVTTVALTKSDWRIAVFGGIIPVLFMLIDASYKRYQICFVERTREIMRLLNDQSECENLRSNPAYIFPIYDLLGIHGRHTRHDPFDQDWGGLRAPLRKASVTFVYMILLTISVVVSAMLATS